MGGTVGRVAAGIATGGLSEAGRAAGRAIAKKVGGGTGKLLGTVAAGAIGGGGVGVGGVGTGAGIDASANAIKGALTASTVADAGDPVPQGSELTPTNEFDEKKKRRALRATTLLTGARGALGSAPVGVPVLLGGGSTRQTLG